MAASFISSSESLVNFLVVAFLDDAHVEAVGIILMVERGPLGVLTEAQSGLRKYSQVFTIGFGGVLKGCQQSFEVLQGFILGFESASFAYKISSGVKV